MGELGLRRATIEDAEAIGRVLGRAFHDDPVINWIIRQDERRPEHIETLFRVVSRYAYLADDASWVLQDGSGASVWRPPGVAEPEEVPEIAEVWPSITADPDRNAAVGALEALHPKEPDHYYLFAIGVDPAQQGGGRGSALIRANLDICDAEGIPAYLENSKRQNLPFYERHHFRVIEEHTLPDGGPTVWRMWRDPASSS
jgi:GNAT superfamily N-acetyltransferase